jgi:hypothetical protein
MLETRWLSWQLLSLVKTVLPSSHQLAAERRKLDAGLPLRFAAWLAPPPRKTRFRLLARLRRTGLITRRVSMKVSHF